MFKDKLFAHCPFFRVFVASGQYQLVDDSIFGRSTDRTWLRKRAFDSFGTAPGAWFVAIALYFLRAARLTAYFACAFLFRFCLLCLAHLGGHDVAGRNRTAGRITFPQQFPSKVFDPPN